jgi:RecB family exonuclease
VSSVTAAPPQVAALRVPERLPRRRYGSGWRLDVLSPASVRAFERCPEAFRRRYLLGEREPANLAMTLGSVVGDALAHHFQGRIEGKPLSHADLDDLVVELFSAKIAHTALGAEDDPDTAREHCRGGVADYLSELAPHVSPISVERRASFRFSEEQEWRFQCYFDLECAEEVPDVKFGKRPVSEVRAARDLQATAYAYLRWAEGRPARFVFHSGVLEPEEAPRWRVVPAPRTVAQFRGVEQRVARVARQIAHLDQTEPGEWPLASDLGWWCAPRERTDGCPYWDSCPVGGG